MLIEARNLDGRNIGSIIEHRTEAGVIYGKIEQFTRNAETKKVHMLLSGDVELSLDFDQVFITRRNAETAMLSQLRDTLDEVADKLDELTADEGVAVPALVA